ncbi:MAG TPA: hypothetical protein VGZ73_24365 [Bryobacteraceae bacterium]|nr:hypothetical protein [Bryobacteraceae bacterium]
MPRDRLAHLSDEELAAYQDGERSPADGAHLEGCAQCTARLHSLEAAIAAYTEYRDSIRSPQLPPVPAPWRRVDQLAADHESQRRRRVWQWWLPALAAACGLVVLITGGLRNKEDGSQRVSQLLERAAVVSMPADRMISMRMHGHTLLRPAVLTGDSGVDSDPELTHAEKLFQTAHYGWREPLSPRTFQAWRGVQKNRRDSVSMIVRAGRERMYRVRTEVPSGVLRGASLILRAGDLRPAGGDFEFEGEGPVSMEEVPAPATSTPAPPLPAPAEPAVETPVGPAEILHVLAALDAIGADAGEPIDVTEDAAHRHVVVRAGGLSAARRQAVLTALAALPRVTVDFQSRALSVAPPQTIPPQTYFSSIPSQFRQRLEDSLGGPVALQEITDRVLEASAQNLGRAHAIEVLARDFPAETEGGMNSQDRLLLRQLRRRHLAELERLARQIRESLKPLLEIPDATPRAVGDNGRAQTWQSGVPTLMASAQETDQLLNHLLAGSYSQSSGEEMLRRLTAALGRLERAVESESNVE